MLHEQTTDKVQPKEAEHRLERITTMMITKYGDDALSKAVRAAKFYAGENDTAQMRLWVSIGERIKHKQLSVSEATTAEDAT